MRALIALIVVVAVLASAAAGTMLWENWHFNAAGPGAAETTVRIRQGSSVRLLAENLETAGVVDSAFLFRVGVLRRGAQARLKAGEYAFPAHTSMAEAMDRLVRHDVVEHRITIAEGLTSDMALDIVKADPVLEGEASAVPEGKLLPETYLFEWGTTRAEMLARMQKAQETLLAELWPKRKEGLPIQTQEEAITLASIVEKETGVPSERPRIAAVFVNRLRNGMKLESDPTIIYGLTKGMPLGHPLRQSELAAPNPYSTYQIAGLPPTPIANPGRAAIAAVLNPPESNEIFFVANGTGGHAFAATIQEHERNVAAWRRLERDRAASQSETPRLR